MLVLVAGAPLLLASCAGTGTDSGPGQRKADATSTATSGRASPDDSARPSEPPEVAATTAVAQSSRGPAALAPAPRGALLRLPLPGSASASGAYVSGYPRQVVPPAPRSRLTSTSVAPSGDRLQVALAASSPARGSFVLRFYRLHLARFGFTETPAPAMGGSEAAAFRRGPDVVTVTVTQRDRTSYTIYGTLHGA